MPTSLVGALLPESPLRLIVRKSGGQSQAKLIMNIIDTFIVTDNDQIYVHECDWSVS